eukprot:SAG22_NODE_3780_length_1532_cov_1.836706_1_plen_89_part_00
MLSSNVVNEVSAKSGAMSVIWLTLRSNLVNEVSADSERRGAPLLLCLFLNTLDRVRDRFCAGGQFLVELPADTGGAPDLLVAVQLGSY